MVANKEGRIENGRARQPSIIRNNINRSSVLGPSETKRSLSVRTASSRARSVLKTGTISLPGSDTKRAVHFVLFFHRRAAPARFAAIPTWRRRWAVGALGARPDAYTLRRIEAALVLHNGLCHSHKRQWYGRMQSTRRREKTEDVSREKQSQWSETTGKQTPQQQQGPAQAAEGRIRNQKAAPQRVTSSGSSKQLSHGNASTAT